MSSEPPEEPHLRAAHNPLSPASPKPVHFPTPTNITVLDMQMDVGFNQTEAHMNDPSMHNTEVRPDFWRDPNEVQQKTEDTDHASPYSTGGEAMETIEQNGNVEEEVAQPEVQNTSSNETALTNDAASSTQLQPVQLFTSDSSNEASGTEAAAQSKPSENIQPTADINVTAMQDTSVQQSNQETLPDQSNQDGGVPIASDQAFDGNTVDVQALIDTLSAAPSAAPNATGAANTAPQAEGMTIATTLSPSAYAQSNPASQTPQQAPPPGVESSPLSAAGLGIPPSGLPPRPPPQEQPLIHPNYVHSQHIRDYHPHASHPAFQPHVRSGSSNAGNVADPNSRNYVPPVHSPSGGGPPSAAPGTTGATYTTSPTTFTGSGYNPAAPNGQGGSPQAASNPAGGSYTSFAGSPQQQSPSSATLVGWNAPAGNAMYNPAQPYGILANSTPTDQGREPGRQQQPEDRPWDAEVQRKYDRFIEDERRYVSEGRWEQFPQGSRLFVGNLSSEKVTKRDIFHVFHTYGDLAQISIKQAYGFVQFLRTEDCMTALEREQGTRIRDKNIHLEVSKPQKNRNQNQQRRSRSPPGGRAGSNVDRYTSGARTGNNRGGRDGYRPGYRSPSPRGYRDRYDDRYQPRPRSPGYDRGGSGRYRSPTPRRETDDDLPLPKRERRDVPDVQIIVLDSLDRDFISWVETAFSGRGVRVDVLLLSPRLSEQAVVRRQIMEGVVAVVKLTRQNQNSGKIGLQIFDRRNGVGNVTFEEYDGLDPPIAVELVLRAKLTHGAPNQASQGYGGGYGAPQQPQQQQYRPAQQYGAQPAYATPQQPNPSAYGQTPQPAYPSPTYPPPNYGQPTQQPQAAPPNLQSLITNLGATDPNNLQSLLSSMGTPQSAASNAYGQTPTNSAVQQQMQNNPALAGYLQQAAPQGGTGGAGGGQVNMQDILARLGSYQQR